MGGAAAWFYSDISSTNWVSSSENSLCATSCVCCSINTSITVQAGWSYLLTLLSMCGGSALSVWDESVATVTSERCRYEVYIFDKNKLSQEIAVGESTTLPVWPLVDFIFTFHLSFYDLFFHKSVPSPSIRPSIHISLPQSHSPLCSSQTSRTSECQISTHVWSSSDMSSIYPCILILSFSLFLFLFVSSPSFSHLVVFFMHCLFL